MVIEHSEGAPSKKVCPQGPCWDYPASITGMNFILISSLSVLTPFECTQDTFSPLRALGSIHRVNINAFKIFN